MTEPRRHRVGLGATLLLGLLAVVVGSGPAAARPVPDFTAYASCSPDGVRHSRPTHVCQQGDMVRAVARYGGTPPVSYRLCLSFGKAKRRCGESQPTVPGEPSILFLPTGDSVGLATVSWRVDNTEVASYSIRFVKQPIVPPFGISPLILSGKRRLFGLIVRHLPEGLRVRAWRDCRRGCPLPLRQVYRNGETRRYRIVASKPKATFNFGDELQVLIDAPWRPEGSKLWGRLYRGKLVRDRKGGPGDTAIRRVKPALCIPPGRGKLLRIARKCNKVRSSKAPLQRITSRLGFD